MFNRRKRAILFALLLSLAAVGGMSGCSEVPENAQTEAGTGTMTGTMTETERQTGTGTESETALAAQQEIQSEPQTETEIDTEAVTEAETETEYQTEIEYISEDGTVSLILPDSTWRVTQDEEELRIFAAGSDAMINIAHADDETELDALALYTSREELEESLVLQYPETDAFEIRSFEALSSSTLNSYEYVIHYTYPTSMWTYFVTWGILTAEEDEAYVITGTVAENDEELLAAVQKSVESFKVLDDSVFSVLPGLQEETEPDTEEETESDIDAQLSTLAEYEAGVVLYASASDVNIRQQPGIDAVVIGSLAQGEAVTVTGETSQWFRVSINGSIGYVSKAYLVNDMSDSGSSETAFSEPQSDSEEASADMSAELNTKVDYGASYVYYTTSSVNLRTQPGTDSAVVSVLSGGSSVTVTGETDNWYLVSVNGMTGYVSKSYVSTGIDSGTDVPQTDVSHTEAPATSGIAAVGGTIMAVTDDKITITGDNGSIYAINYANAKVTVAGGLAAGQYITASIDYSNSTKDALYATEISGN